jgi:hypothetical protein
LLASSVIQFFASFINDSNIENSGFSWSEEYDFSLRAIDIIMNMNTNVRDSMLDE